VLDDATWQQIMGLARELGIATTTC
jgi:hypothetical protein